jgi:hypothetical protein
MNDATRIIEQITWVTPFGVRFWDEVSGSIIGDGLRVTAYRATTPNVRIAAFVNHSGVYILRNVPGLRIFEQGAGDKDFWNNLPSGRPFIIEVIDSYRRFQPFLFTATLPTKGLFTLDCTLGSPLVNSPLTSPLGPAAGTGMVLLYSSPTRTVADIMAVLRAQLWDDKQNIPAAWAMLEVFVAGQFVRRSYADDKGRVAVFFPYPAPEHFADADTSGSFVSSSVALARQQWNIHVQVAYPPRTSMSTIPDLCTVLSQPAAQVWDDSTHTQPFTGGTLTFGQELTLRSSQIGPQTPPSVLLITPAV